jgi:NADPH:quinone reductase-like Zn-dependent oxidoreductase
MTEEMTMTTEQKQVETGQMKAIVRERFGSPDVLELKEIEKPAPDDVRGVLVKVYASSVNPADRYDVNGMTFALRLVLPLFRMSVGVRRPKERQVGTDLAGRVEAVSDNVKQFKRGDEVYGVGFHGYAEYAVAKEGRLALKPVNRSFEESAAVPIAGFTALQALRDHGQIKPGQKVLVNGAGGGVGTFAVQIAKALGAEVTAVTNTQNLDMVRSLGADHVIDYVNEDFTKNGEKYDVICDIASSHPPSAYKPILNDNGICVIVGFKDKVIRRLVFFVIRRPFARGDKKFVFFVAKPNQEDLSFLKELMEAGKVTPVIDRRYPLSETPQAIKYLGAGKARGKIVISIADDEPESWSKSYQPSRKEAQR